MRDAAPQRRLLRVTTPQPGNHALPPQGPPFSDREVERYARHLVLREVGGPGQQRLKASSILLIGVGGVGAPAALYLAAAGVGRIGLLDDDHVALSNLQRQILFSESDIGRPKVEAGRERLEALNGDVRVESLPRRLDAGNAASLLAGWDLIIDGSDSFETRLAVSDACVRAGRPLVSAALGRWETQVGLFRGRPCYRCWVGGVPPQAETCAAVGVVGALAGVAGSMATLLAIRTVAGVGPDAAGRLMLLDGLGWTSRTLQVRPDPACLSCGQG